MSYCNQCHVRVVSKTDLCPLCRSPLLMDDMPAKASFPVYKTMRSNYSRAILPVSLLAVVLIVGAVLLNLLVLNQNYWSVVFSSCVLYLWALGLITFNRKVRLGVKLILHTVTISAVCIIINKFATTTLDIHRATWALSYVMPLTILGCILLIGIIMISNKHLFKEFLMYQFSMCFMGFIPIAVVYLKAVEPLYPSVITALVSYLMIIVMMAFSKSIVVGEFKKRFHI